MAALSSGRRVHLVRAVPLVLGALAVLLLASQPAGPQPASAAVTVELTPTEPTPTEPTPTAPPPGSQVQARSGGGVAGDVSYVVDTSTGPRTFVLHLPGGVAPTEPAPLVLVLPGLARTAASTVRETRFDAVGDATGAVIAYVDGERGSWAAGRCCGYAAAARIDDVSALHEVVDGLATLTPIDRRRVVLAGFSNGGMLAYRVACQEARGIAGIIVASGALVVPHCSPSAPVSVVASHGLLDRTVPEQGQARSPYLRTSTPSLTASLQPFLRLAGCRSNRTQEAGRWSVDIRRNCRQGSSITVFRDAQGLHRWPSITVPSGQTFAAQAYGLLADRRSLVDFGSG